MSGKTLFIWVLAHVVIASVVMDEMRKRGKSDQDARLAGHAAGSLAGLVLSSAL
ncbi:MAG: hypothetical protein ACRDPA_04650 [Solirubrobacteraceae bacterium]